MYPLETILSARISRPPLSSTLGQKTRARFTGHTILLTGAGGSVGKALAQQLVKLPLAQLVLVDRNEEHLYHLEQSLETIAPHAVCTLADVQHPGRLDALFTTHKPTIVIHAAAYKHVPLLEAHPIEAFENNTLATVHVLRACEQHNVEQFALISTDKAVEPTSILGSTKRWAEWYTKTAKIQAQIIRFGNVFGSSGSVALRFEDQIRAGKPLTITHPDMTRYFMTSSEASHLIIQALLLRDAPVYILNMGEPIRIQWLAETMHQTLAPDQPLKIVYTGTRPGEKLVEQLWGTNETPRETLSSHLIALDSPGPYSRTFLDSYLAELTALCKANDQIALRAALFETATRDYSVPTV